MQSHEVSDLQNIILVMEEGNWDMKNSFGAHTNTHARMHARMHTPFLSLWTGPSLLPHSVFQPAGPSLVHGSQSCPQAPMDGISGS